MRKLLNALLAYECLTDEWLDAQRRGEENAVPTTYLHRWRLLALPGKRRVYIHWFVGPDWSRAPHDHPKWFLSIMLRGWYVERSPDRSPPDRIFRAPHVRWFPATHRHAIIEVAPRGCVTLVVTGPERREWGFWPTSNGRTCWIPWKRYIFGRERHCG